MFRSKLNQLHSIQRTQFSTTQSLWTLQSKSLHTTMLTASGQNLSCSMKMMRYFTTKSKNNTPKNDKLFDKILIANRGEIACRVIRTCQKLGIKTVAIYSEPDRNSVHVGMADEAICVGPAASSSSYLNIPNILDAVKQTGAQAVHPGYGFLSENKIFQESLQKIGVKFIGPGTHAIQAMGDKISSKKIAQDAKVNIIPGYLGAVNTDEDLIRIANEIGYPVMIKATAGGGGKGMRIAYTDQEAIDGYRLSKAEALSSFGDDTMFVEKFIEEPRHIEIQLLCDSQGNGIYLNERECSVQRRNQKVIEEAPSVFLDAKTRRAMGEQAVALAKAVGYESAGTCEFLVDKHRNFYFLEMNTRLQVEHPVTECITGLDLVEHMIRVAAGHPLSLSQKDVQLNGWAFEARVYAEDPLRGFLPSIGRLEYYDEPYGDNIRVDSGVREGGEISIHYDPMISKLITYGETRDEALEHMRQALDRYVIRGVTNNINFLRSLCDHPRFIKGNLTTKFIQDEYPDGYTGAVLSKDEKNVLIAGALSVQIRKMSLMLSNQAEQVGHYDADYALDHRMENNILLLGDEKVQVRVDNIYIEHDEYSFEFSLHESEEKFEVKSNYASGELLVCIQVNGNDHFFQVVTSTDQSPHMTLLYAGSSFPISFYSPRQYELLAYMPIKEVIDTSKLVLSPMPGAVFSIKVKAGDHVVPGQEVCVIEAMKMQNALRTVSSGIVKAVHVKQGQTVTADQLLIELE